MDLICFCHLRWNFVYQRPQHLMTRFSRSFRVFFVEEPIFDTATPWLEERREGSDLFVIVPHLPHGDEKENLDNLRDLLSTLPGKFSIESYIAWFYTPMALPQLAAFTAPVAIVYDCMDELSAFKNAPASLGANEMELMRRADLVFTGGQSLWEAKKNMHHSIFAYPSSIDKTHFAQAREVVTDPPDQQDIPHPRAGFFGVIDERLDIELLGELAGLRPDLHLVILGPTVKIDPATLPRRDNIHYLGSKSYQELPIYMAGWDVALIPFAINESTRFISPTKTPEYLAGGKPVVSTPITDVIDPYGKAGLVTIAGNAQEFARGIDQALLRDNRSAWLKSVDLFLEDISWDNTWESMLSRINELVINRVSNYKKKETEHV